MLFHTVTFVVFLGVTVGLLLALRRHSSQKVALFVASAIFYMWWNPAYILLIAFTATVDYNVAVQLDRTEAAGRRKGLLFLSLVSNLGLLGFFKYANFFQDNAFFVARLLGYEPTWSRVDVLLPVGISFYTFQSLSYTIDVYRKHIPVCRNLVDFPVFVMFFPQLVAGPIVRAADFLPQLEKPAVLTLDRTVLFLFVRGLAKKVIFADGVAAFSDAVFTNPGAWPSVVIWLAALCFYVQIYCDFSGYSDMAIAVAAMLGYKLPLNFNRPYFSGNPSEFWRRWHISLSSWLRDYLYIPLGGNRGGTSGAMRNQMLTMLIGGLWHGASWSFVLWGALHGLALAVHRGYGALVDRAGVRPVLSRSVAYRVLAVLLMQYWVLLTWIPFRIPDSGRMVTALRKFIWFDFDFRVADLGLGAMSPFSTALLLVLFAALHGLAHAVGGLDVRLSRARPLVAGVLCLGIGAALFLLWPTEEAPFIYFQF